MARRIAEEYGLEHVYAGKIFREMAREHGMTLEEFSEYAERHPEIDLEIDRRQRKAAERGNVVLEGRLAAAVATGLVPEPADNVATLRIWLKAPLDVRAERVAERDGLDVEEAKEKIRKREESELKRYEEIYDIDPTDPDLYDLILDTSLWDVEETFAILKTAIDPLAEREDP